MEAGPLGELMTEAGDSLVTSPVAEVGQAIAKELAPVRRPAIWSPRGVRTMFQWA